MTDRIVQEEKYGKRVWTNVPLDAARARGCLCLSCERLKPRRDDNCPHAETFFAACRTVGMAVAVTRCALYVGKPSADSLV